MIEVLPATLDLDSPLTDWAPVLASVGLLLITLLLLVSLVAAVLRVYRLVCPCTRRPQHRLLESPASSQYATSKQGLVHSWLGQQTSTGPLLYPAPQPGLIVYPPPLLWLLLEWVTVERYCPCKQPACPAVGSSSEVTFKLLHNKEQRSQYRSLRYATLGPSQYDRDCHYLISHLSPSLL
ncbi:hypothetical protein J6590_040590 [Homalodisca vitripennis]|nr:hypothetical protein J6590_040590 [Homalodisca vitripennis]